MNIPGAVDGWVTLHEKYGSRPFASLLEPAIHYAEDGFPIGEKISQVWEYGASKLRLFPDSKNAYLIDGKAPKAGQKFRQKELAETLKLIARGEKKLFIMDLFQNRFLPTVLFWTKRISKPRKANG